MFWIVHDTIADPSLSALVPASLPVGSSGFICNKIFYGLFCLWHCSFLFHVCKSIEVCVNLLFWSTTCRNVTQKNIITGSQYQFRSAVFFLSVCTNTLYFVRRHCPPNRFPVCFSYCLCHPVKNISEEMPRAAETPWPQQRQFQSWKQHKHAPCF